MNMSLLNLKREHTILGIAFRRVMTLQWRNVLGATLEEIMMKTLAIQVAELENVQPDVLIGSSWGGAIALVCIAKGHYKGPVVLVAPALRRICELGAQIDWEEIYDAVAKSGCQIVVYHGTADNVIPFGHSEELRERCANVTLVPVEGGDHRLDTPLVTGDVLKQAVVDLLASKEGNQKDC